jgi:hypothetical protein
MLGVFLFYYIFIVMKKVVKLTESDLKRIIEKVIKEGVFMTNPISDFGDGTYTLTKINVDKSATQKGDYFIKNGKEFKIISGQIVTYENGTIGGYGSGVVYQG